MQVIASEHVLFYGIITLGFKPLALGDNALLTSIYDHVTTTPVLIQTVEQNSIMSADSPLYLI
jgi:hypothetical protein